MVASRGLRVHVHGELRDLHDGLDLDIDQPLHFEQRCANPSGVAPEHAEVVSAHLDRERRALPGEHVLDAVRDGLPDDHRSARHDVQALAKVCEDLFA